MSVTVVPTVSKSEVKEFSPFAKAIYEQKYAMRLEDGRLETWPETALRVVSNVLGALGYTESDGEFQSILKLIEERKFIPGGRYLYSAGREYHQVNNCLLMKAEDSREGWASLLYKAGMALQTGAGIGIDYSDIREAGASISKTGGVASGPLPLMEMIDKIGRGVMQGGARRSAIWAGLSWSHPDCEEFITMKNWSEDERQLKEKDSSFPLRMEYTNISVLLDDEFFAAYADPNHIRHRLAKKIYLSAVKGMVQTAEPGFSVDLGDNAKETLRNACTELSSEDDSDICNIGSLNLSQFEDQDEFGDAVDLAMLFLLAGTVYSDVPYDKVAEVRAQNRRLGLGLMGFHEWLLKRGYRYGPNDELGEWLSIYQGSTRLAHRWAKRHQLSYPVKTRAVAPNGTIAILAETTSGIEPIFCVAYKRRYKEASPHGDVIKYQYVVDPTAKRLIDGGVDPDSIEDAYTLSYDVERRVGFQAWVQQFVDHGISSTINLPYQIIEEAEIKDVSDMLIDYLPRLRGITAYPDGCRGGQPLTTVPYSVAVNNVGVVYEEDETNACKSGVCGV